MLFHPSTERVDVDVEELGELLLRHDASEFVDELDVAFVGDPRLRPSGFAHLQAEPLHVYQESLARQTDTELASPCSPTQEVYPGTARVVVRAERDNVAFVHLTDGTLGADMVGFGPRAADETG